VGSEEVFKVLRKAKPQFVERGQEKSVYDYARAMKL